MARLLCIESSAEVCSVVLSHDAKVVAQRESAQERDHAKQLAPFIAEVLHEAGTTLSELDAVAVSKGPGSYTSLRIGVSTAKGLCFGANKPLIAISSLQSIAVLGKKNACVQASDWLCPMTDARRMEVYTAMFNTQLQSLTPTTAMELTEESFANELATQRIVFMGSGSHKFQSLQSNPNAVFIEVSPSAIGMIHLAEEHYAMQNFEDLAYFEPLYLKDFVALKSTKKMF
ncbi:MAG: tRNA (adenosine(37)-N6)-threonylcarbamoyltransferase complex dimerization subunit type 1 TsaB [Bacteroidales bacterium]